MTAPRIAYLTTEYPHVSHTFIRREILGLEQRGHDVVRVALRAGSAIVDAEDEAEAARTLHLFAQSKRWLLARALLGLWLAGASLPGTLRTTLSLSRASERGLIRHFAYFVEALCIRAYLAKEGVDHVHVYTLNRPELALAVCQRIYINFYRLM